MDELNAEILHNCWILTGITGDWDDFTDITQDDERDEVEELLSEVMPPRQNMSTNALLSLEHEDDCIERTTTKRLWMKLLLLEKRDLCTSTLLGALVSGQRDIRSEVVM